MWDLHRPMQSNGNEKWVQWLKIRIKSNLIKPICRSSVMCITICKCRRTGSRCPVHQSQWWWLRHNREEPCNHLELCHSKGLCQVQWRNPRWKPKRPLQNQEAWPWWETTHPVSLTQRTTPKNSALASTNSMMPRKDRRRSKTKRAASWEAFSEALAVKKRQNLKWLCKLRSYRKMPTWCVPTWWMPKRRTAKTTVRKKKLTICKWCNRCKPCRLRSRLLFKVEPMPRRVNLNSRECTRTMSLRTNCLRRPRWRSIEYDLVRWSTK